MNSTINTGDTISSATLYAIATQRNMYQPDYEGAGHATWLTDEDGGYNQDPLTFDSIKKAQEHIDDADKEIYVTSNNEAGRPDWWIVPVDVIDSVRACHDDNGNYNWPGDCDTWECGDGNGNVCGECDHCLNWMADQDEEMLRAGNVEAP